MRKQVLAWALFVFAISSVACVAKNVVIRVKNSDEKLKGEGVFYALPRTVIGVEVPIVKTRETPGKHVKFTKCFFFRPDEWKKPDPNIPGKDIDKSLEELDIIEKEKTNYSMGTPVISSRSEPDPQEIFMVKIKGHYFEDKNFTLDWTEDGVMTKGVMETTNRTMDVITQAAQTAAALAIKAGAVGFNESAIRNVLDGLDDKVKADTDCTKLAFKLDAYGKPDFTNSLADYKEAKQAYGELSTWKDVRANLLANDRTASPPETFQLMLKEIDAQIKLFREMFFGSTTKTEQGVARFAVTPPPADWDKPFHLFMISADKGACAPAAANSAVSYSLSPELQCLDAKNNPVLCPCANTGDKKPILLKLQRAEAQLATELAAVIKPPDAKDERGFVYRVPAAATVSLFQDNKETRRLPLLIAQLGTTISLPASTGGRKTSYTVELFTSGALKNFKLGSEALLQSTTVSGFGTAAGTILDARAKAEQEAVAAATVAAAAASDVNQLKKMSELLEACQRLKKAQIDLGQPVNLPPACTP